ncbi:VOC family protein [Corticibacter populi]|uniref:Bleomycin resistance protein n=1 Tax=Corticibacter populi TaxID=1550736 RepID=A0A3M6QNX4_9BURK|nr:VOC family protein [Corticibacter populi]RMX04754.1 VOC family protein [Corticibacter populi]RZS33842.1 hypothetical protein EV687_2169 [Corticibacter populi]
MSESILSTAIPQLPSGDIRITAAFFADGLGFEIAAVYAEQRFLIVRRGGAEVHFWQTDTAEDARHYGAASSCYIRVRGIDLLHAEFLRRGVQCRQAPLTQPWGMREMQVDDPYGNAIRFGEDPG